MSKNAAAALPLNLPVMTSGQKELGLELLAEINSGNPDMDNIKSLIARGASLEETGDDDKKRTPLLIASGGGRSSEAAFLLLAAGANPNARGHDGAAPLLMAVLTRNLELTEALIAHGAHLDDTASKGKTPLMWAAHMGLLDFTKKLLDAGANAELKMHTGMDAAAFAESNNKYHIQKYIQQHIARGQEARAAFEKAVKSGLPLDKDITPLRMKQPRKRTPKNHPRPS